MEFINVTDFVYYYMTFGFMFAFLLYVFVVMGSMALRVLRFSKDFDLSK